MASEEFVKADTNNLPSIDMFMVFMVMQYLHKKTMNGLMQRKSEVLKQQREHYTRNNTFSFSFSNIWIFSCDILYLLTNFKGHNLYCEYVAIADCVQVKFFQCFSRRIWR